MPFNKFVFLSLLIAGSCGISWAQKTSVQPHSSQAASSSAKPSTPTYEPLPLDPHLRYGVLSNGLTYYVRHNETTKSRADFYIIQDVGAILEQNSQKGLAHFLEHMAFQGTKNLPGKMIIDYLESVGVKFGANINAYTSLDETVYNLSAVPTYRSGIVDTALLVLHDWSSFLTLDGSEIDKERGVIREEWRTRNKANRRMWTASLPVMFPNSQYAGRDVIGDTAIINNFPYDTLRAYYHQWYRPDLQAIAIVGDVDVDSVVAKLKLLFADIPHPVNASRRIYYPLQPNAAPIVGIFTDPEARQTIMDLEYRHDPVPDKIKASVQGYCYDLVQNLVSQMLASRLAEIVQENNSPFASVSCDYGELVRTCDAFSLYAVPSEGKEKQAFARLLLEAERARRFGFTATELDRAKADVLSSFEKAFNERDKCENEDFIQEYKRNFLDFEPVPGIEWEFPAVQSILPSVSLEDVNAMLQSHFFGDKNITFEVTGPDFLKSMFTADSIRSAILSMDSLSVSPYVDQVSNAPLIPKTPKKGKIVKSEHNAALGFTQWTLSNGIKVSFYPTTFKKDEVQLYAFAPGGLSLQSSVAQLPSCFLASDIVENNGLGSFSAIALRKALAGKMVNISPRISQYEHSLSGSSSVKDCSSLLQLFYLYFTGVRSDDNGYASVLNQYRTALIHRSSDPSSAFSDSVSLAVTGHSPRTLLLDTSLLSSVHQQEALDFFRTCFSSPASFNVVLVGNVSPDSLKSLILTYLGGIPKQKKQLVWVDRKVRVPQGQLKVDFEKNLQINKASNFVYYTAPMQPSLQNRVLLSVLKNVLAMRYLESMRENEGGTYGVSTRGSLDSRPVQQVALQMTFDTDPKVEGKMMSLIQAAMDTISKKGVLPEDLSKTKEILVKSYKENVLQNDYWISAISAYLRDGIDLNTSYLDLVNRVIGDDVVSFLRTLLASGNRLQVVMMPSSSK